MSQKLEELLRIKDLNGRKWSLLYQGSRDGFRTYNFNSHCDDKPNTLIILKSTSGNVFGGFTRAQWNSTGLWQFDKSAFIFSLVNNENKSILFENKSNKKDSIYTKEYFCIKFGGGYDIFISDNSNSNTNSFSNLGYTYTHPEYPFGSEKAKTILAGTHYFQVEEIEVFQMQH